VRRVIERHPATSLFLLAAALGAGPIGLVAAGVLPAGFDQLGALSASAAGIILAAVIGGKAGVRRLLARGLIWRVPAGWWLLVLLFPAVPTLGALYLTGPFGGQPASLDGVGSILRLLPLLGLLILFAGLGEEFGWRGFGVPRMQRRYNALTAGLIIGLFHSLWHVPLFFVEGVSQHDIAQQLGLLPAVFGYTVLVTATAVQLSWVFNNTRGSVLMVAVYHGASNAWNGYIDIYRGQTTGVLVYTGLMALISVVVVAVFGAEHLSRTARRVVEPAP
jgi:membrane protease YdiL (CAAX protease family)